MEGYAAFMILVYPVGIPLLYAVVLGRERRLLRDEATRDEALARRDTGVTRTEMLWETYDARCWWWEIFDCGRRLMLLSVTEPDPCAYRMNVTHPLACRDGTPAFDPEPIYDPPRPR